jgi:hypothetical protein
VRVEGVLLSSAVLHTVMGSCLCNSVYLFNEDCTFHMVGSHGSCSVGAPFCHVLLDSQRLPIILVAAVKVSPIYTPTVSAIEPPCRVTTVITTLWSSAEVSPGSPLPSTSRANTLRCRSHWSRRAPGSEDGCAASA